ncbi:MAG: type VI secretion system protein TssA [Massilia sp.]
MSGLNIEALLAPIAGAAGAAGCGEDLAFSSELDAIARARQADDPSIEQGAWVTTLKEADWKFVSAGCSRLLQAKSKDLRLAVWLAEASAKTAGLRGLGEALMVTAGLCERYWDELHPLPDEGSHEQRIGNLCWIAARIAQLARELPVTQGELYSLNDFAFARAHAGAVAGEEGASAPNGPGLPVLEAARRKSGAAFYQRMLSDCAFCEDAIAALEKVTDARLGEDGPGFTAAREKLKDVVHFAAAMARHETPAAVPVKAPMHSAAPVSMAPQPAPLLTELTEVSEASRPLQSRAQALAQLRAVAAFFRQTEPHSPVAYLADKAASWGEQPLHVWLRGVIKDDVQYTQLEEMLGARSS